MARKMGKYERNLDRPAFKALRELHGKNLAGAPVDMVFRTGVYSGSKVIVYFLEGFHPHYIKKGF
jgi:hypothetical protein